MYINIYVLYYVRVCAIVRMPIVSANPPPRRTGRDQMPSLPETIDTWLFIHIMMYNNNNNNNITAAVCICTDIIVLLQ